MKRPAAPKDLPATAPVFPLTGALLLPNTRRPLNIFEERFIDMIDYSLANQRLVVLAQPKKTDEEAPEGRVPLWDIGCLGRLVHFEDAEDRYLIVLEGVCRVKLGAEIASDQKFRQFEIDASAYASDFEPEFGEHAVDRSRFIDMMRSYADFASLDLDWKEIEETGTAELVNLCCMLSPYGAEEKQALLEAKSLQARAETLIAMAEIEMARAQTGHVLQ